ncbi:UMP kinase [Candidatus Riflebacteria bacterium]
MHTQFKLDKPPKRILLKLSGEFIKGESQRIHDPKIFSYLITEMQALRNLGIEIGIVIGGGNIYRGAQELGMPIPRVDGDTMGLLATYINALALKFSFEQSGLKTKAFASKNLFGIIEEFDRIEAIRCLQEGYIVIFGGGTGNPFFTTDTAGALKALEINADLFLKATKVDGVYSDDPDSVKDAIHYPELTYDEVIDKKLKVMDLTAITLCRENNLPLVVFAMGPGQIQKLLKNEVKCSWVFSQKIK